MADKTISRLEHFRPMFYDELDVDDILEHLEGSQVITSYEKKDIKKETESDVKVDFLLGCLENYGDKGYPLFIRALQAHRGKYTRMVRVLEEEEDQSIQERKLPAIPWQATAESLADFPWYVKEMDRDQAARLVEMIGEDGRFLVRLGSKRDTTCPFVLTVLASGRSWHVQIGKRANQKYAMGAEKPSELAFTSIPDMIHYFHTNVLELKESGDKSISVKLSEYPAM